MQNQAVLILILLPFAAAFEAGVRSHEVAKKHEPVTFQFFDGFEKRRTMMVHVEGFDDVVDTYTFPTCIDGKGKKGCHYPGCIGRCGAGCGKKLDDTMSVPNTEADTPIASCTKKDDLSTMEVGQGKGCHKACLNHDLCVYAKECPGSVMLMDGEGPVKFCTGIWKYAAQEYVKSVVYHVKQHIEHQDMNHLGKDKDSSCDDRSFEVSPGETIAWSPMKKSAPMAPMADGGMEDGMDHSHHKHMLFREKADSMKAAFALNFGEQGGVTMGSNGTMLSATRQHSTRLQSLSDEDWVKMVDGLHSVEDAVELSKKFTDEEVDELDKAIQRRWARVQGQRGQGPSSLADVSAVNLTRNAVMAGMAAVSEKKLMTIKNAYHGLPRAESLSADQHTKAGTSLIEKGMSTLEQSRKEVAAKKRELMKELEEVNHIEQDISKGLSLGAESLKSQSTGAMPDMGKIRLANSKITSGSLLKKVSDFEKADARQQSA